MRRSAAVLGLSLLVVLAATVVALAVVPRGGSWWSSNSDTLTVNSAGTKITALNSQKCRTAFTGARIKSNGRFSVRSRPSFEGGKRVKQRIKGRFTSDVRGRVSVKVGKCHSAFNIYADGTQETATPTPEATETPEAEETPEPDETVDPFDEIDP